VQDGPPQQPEGSNPPGTRWRPGDGELVEREKAEHKPLPTTSQRRLSRRSDDSLAPDACSWSISIWKLNFSEVRSNAPVYCTLGVEDVAGTLQLYRGASFILIGVDSQDGPNSINLTADGICANSTWQYNAYLDYTATNGSGRHEFGHWFGPQWITC
jgi:hypothetical protein